MVFTENHGRRLLIYTNKLLSGKVSIPTMICHGAHQATQTIIYTFQIVADHDWTCANHRWGRPVPRPWFVTVHIELLRPWLDKHKLWPGDCPPTTIIFHIAHRTLQTMIWLVHLMAQRARSPDHNWSPCILTQSYHALYCLKPYQIMVGDHDRRHI